MVHGLKRERSHLLERIAEKEKWQDELEEKIQIKTGEVQGQGSVLMNNEEHSEKLAQVSAELARLKRRLPEIDLEVENVVSRHEALEKGRFQGMKEEIALAYKVYHAGHPSR